MFFLKFRAFFMSLLMCFLSLFGSKLVNNYKVAEPVGTGHFTPKEAVIVNDADIYVSVNGSDDGDGSFSGPFATIEKARDAVRNLDKSGKNGITVAITAGEYRVSSLEFTAGDSGTENCPVTYCAYGDGEVVLNGGISLSGSDFTKITDEAMLSRLNGKVRDKVVCADLGKFGISAADYGKIYAIGSYNTAMQYDGDYTGSLYSELFVNDKRQTLARYPDEGYLYTEKVIKTGQGKELNGSTTEVAGWENIRNPEPDVYGIGNKLADRINSWKTLKDVWMFGFWKYDWADASSPIGNFDYAKKELSPQFVSIYGTKEGAPYYFFNVFEELDKEGEWYLDRDNGTVYLYPGADLNTATVDLTLTTKPIINCAADNITFSGLTIKGTRGDGIVCNGSNVTVEDCIVKNIAGNGIILTGTGNAAQRNEVTRTGKGGIIISGGDRQTLTRGNSKADNNLIHDWSEIYQTYQPAVTLDGVGNICSHNEIYNSPHEGITYRGNDHLIEYNVLHDVCLLTDDAAAIYAGRRWDWYGTVIRYNCIYNLGSDGHTPDGIYMDDALSGQTVYGNLLVNVPKNGLFLSGGRDLDVRNNIVINTPYRSIAYDQRAIDGVNGGWFTASRPDGTLWSNLYASPWQTDLWKEAYPGTARIKDDFSNQDDPDFGPNPSYSTVTGNLVVNAGKKLGFISEKADKYSNISDNAVFRFTKLPDIFNSPETGDYTLKTDSSVYKQIPDFENLPIAEMGRY